MTTSLERGRLAAASRPLACWAILDPDTRQAAGTRTAVPQHNPDPGKDQPHD